MFPLLSFFQDNFLLQAQKNGVKTQAKVPPQDGGKFTIECVACFCKLVLTCVLTCQPLCMLHHGTCFYFHILRHSSEFRRVCIPLHALKGAIHMIPRKRSRLRRCPTPDVRYYACPVSERSDLHEDKLLTRPQMMYALNVQASFGLSQAAAPPATPARFT